MLVPLEQVSFLPCEVLLQKRKQLRRQLLQTPSLQELKIAVLGGVTTQELVDLLELLLLAQGFRPEFYQSEYNKYFEDAVVQPESLHAFQPDFVYFHTHCVNIQQFPAVGSAHEDFQRALSAELGRYKTIWSAIDTAIGCQIIQNNFETPPIQLLGNLDCVSFGGHTRFVSELNLEFARQANEKRTLVIQDLNTLAASLGHAQWYDWTRWYHYKLLTTPEASLAIARSLASLIGAMLGRAKKCLVLDLDNTLWGGVIGDDGLDNLQIGPETAVGEAYSAFQRYCLELRQRGVLLAVCSKNESDIARSGFAHPASILKLEHFSAFKANWEPKSENLQQIAAELNLSLDSFVFVDDNPAERELVRGQLPMVTVPEVGSDVAFFPSILQGSRCFEVADLSKEDLERSESYAANAKRTSLQTKFADYGEYLDSLQMQAEIDCFQPVYLDRITQLINKTNQFNFTTRRYTLAEIKAVTESNAYLTLYGRLTDVFGDNGLISVLIGRCEDSTLHIDLWGMSCRVLKRNMEHAMLDELVRQARTRGIERITGYYYRTAKNAMVAEHYGTLGFTCVNKAEDGGSSVWNLTVGEYVPLNAHIQLCSPAVI